MVQGTILWRQLLAHDAITSPIQWLIFLANNSAPLFGIDLKSRDELKVNVAYFTYPQ